MVKNWRVKARVSYNFSLNLQSIQRVVAVLLWALLWGSEPGLHGGPNNRVANAQATLEMFCA